MMIFPVFSLLATTVFAIDFPGPPGVDTWCGKAYRSTNASFEPGGDLQPPNASNEMLLDFRIYSRMNIYMADDKNGMFLVDVALSRFRGVSLANVTYPQNPATSYFPKTLVVNIAMGNQTVKSGLIFRVNSTSNEVVFPLANFPGRIEPYPVTVTAISTAGRRYTASTTINILPSKSGQGSIARIDRSNGALMIHKNGSNDFEAIIPVSYYVGWGSFLQKDLENVRRFKGYGYNIIHPIPGGGSNPWDSWDSFEKFFDVCDEIGLYVMYDMRWTYKNATSVTEQVNRFKNRKSLLLWYTADEPDGQGDIPEETKKSYDLVRSLDPYHPVSIVLNCENYYYAEYTKGADIVLQDAYPVAINATFSTVWNTPCNRTYGDCGCDNCIGDFTDVSTRLDTYQKYDTWTGAVPKSFWAVPQAFGNDTYWKRFPTADEEVVMMALSLNHGAKGIVAWTFPTSDELNSATGKLAKIITATQVTEFLTKGTLITLKATGGKIDATLWDLGTKILICVINLDAKRTSGAVTIDTRAHRKIALAVYDVLLGAENNWINGPSGLETDSMAGLGVAMVILDVLDTQNLDVQEGFIANVPVVDITRNSPVL